jgi:uncharacterized protein
VPDDDQPDPQPPRGRRVRRRGLVRRQPRWGRARRVLLWVSGAVVVLAIVLRLLAGWWTNQLWFNSVNYGSVNSKIFTTRLMLAVVFSIVFFIASWVNLWVADRAAPLFFTTTDVVVERYRSLMEVRGVLVRSLVSGVFALIAGLGMAGQWQNWMLLRHHVNTATRDPEFGLRVSTHLFVLPFVEAVINWLFAVLVILSVLAILCHYVNGSLRTQGEGERVSSALKVHLSVIFAALALVRAVAYWVDRWGIVTSNRGPVTGASYTAVKAVIPAMSLLALISVTTAVVLIINVRWRRGSVVGLAVGLWVVVGLVAGSIYPALVQYFSVRPQQDAKEKLYTQRNIDATRQAYNIASVQIESLPLNGVAGSAPAPVLDPARWAKQWGGLTGDAGAGSFASLVVDRYTIDGVTKPVVVGAKQLSAAASGANSNAWSGRKIYTHSVGLGVAGQTEINEGGRPVQIDDAKLGLTEPRMYVGQSGNSYVVANVPSSVDGTPNERGGTASAVTRYDGNGGVRLSSWWRRAAFALTFGESNLMLDNSLPTSARLFTHRDVVDRVSQLVPFMVADNDALPVVADGRVQWIVDLYSTSDRFPYGQFADRGFKDRQSALSQLEPGATLRGRSFNYIRHPAVAVVDAFSGDVQVYVIDKTDPILATWSNVFPSLIDVNKPLPGWLSGHLRVPDQLFRVQASMWSVYGTDTSATDLLAQANMYALPTWPVGQSGDGAPAAASSATGRGSEGIIPPTTGLFSWAANTKREFLTVSPLLAWAQLSGQYVSGDNVTAVMAVSHEAATFGQLRVKLLDGSDRRLTPARFKEQGVNLARQALPGVIQKDLPGTVMVVPNGDDLTYVLAITPDDSALSGVVVGSGRAADAQRFIGVADIGDAVSVVPSTPIATPTDPQPIGTISVAQLLQQARVLLAEADQALADKDTDLYQLKVREAGVLLAQVQQLLGLSNTPTPPSTAPGTTTTRSTTGQSTTTARPGAGGSSSSTRPSATTRSGSTTSTSGPPVTAST